LISSVPAAGGNILNYAGLPLDEDQYPTPYDAAKRTGGVTVVWSKDLGMGSLDIVHPSTITNNLDGTSTLVFLDEIPTGNLIVAYRVVIDRTAEVYATTEEEEDRLFSNTIKLCLELDETARGQWKLPEPSPPSIAEQSEPVAENYDSSRIGTGVFLSPNDFTVTELQPAGGGAPIAVLNVGDPFEIHGTEFPTQAELALSVYIIKVDGNNEIEAVLKMNPDTAGITFDSDTVISVTSLPTPPGALGGDYWIAVGGLHFPDYTVAPPTSQTATWLTIN
jgi:hypothetical protein